jgi:hypothetical protein
LTFVVENLVMKNFPCDHWTNRYVNQHHISRPT